MMFEGLRKFGRHDLPSMLANVAQLLRVLALHVDDRHNSRIPPAFYLFTAVTISVYIYMFVISSCWFIFWREGGELLVKIVLFSLLVSSMIGVTKLVFMYFNSKKVRQLVSDILQHDATVVPDSRMSNNMLMTLRLVWRRAAIFWVLIINNGIVYVLVPILTPGRHLTEDGQVLLGFEPTFESPNYEITFISQWFGTFLVVYVPANITGFIIIIIGYIEAQMLALSQEMLHLWEDALCHCKLIPQQDNCSYNTSNSSKRSRRTSLDLNRNDRPTQYQCYKKGVDDIAIKRAITTPSYDNQSMLNNFIRNRLISIMKMHAININLIKQMKSIFQNALAMEFILLSGGIIAELLGGFENTYMQMPYALIQVSMDCMTGQKLIDANNAFEEAVYGCGWEQFEKGNQRLVLVLLQNAQKTLRLSAGGLTDLSYMTLMNVVRSIYSAYTALRSTMSSLNA